MVDKTVEAIEKLLDALKLQADISKQQHELCMKRCEHIETMLEALIKYQEFLGEMSEPH